MPVAGIDVLRARDDECEDRGDFQNHHHVVGFCRFANAAHQHHGQQHHDQKRREIEAKM